MRRIKNKNVYAKQYKTYFYTVERLNNTQYGHPNFEITIYNNVNKRFDVLGETFHVSTYNDICKYVEKYIDEFKYVETYIAELIKNK